ncbi:MAG: M6 family metalloprotease domain-containing protein [Candidatus Cloacimonetes bacterium]|nr:M6 family metalloprotease domain-containing protein [Candidatus Cloacimonadota bacterium]
MGILRKKQIIASFTKPVIAVVLLLLVATLSAVPAFKNTNWSDRQSERGYEEHRSQARHSHARGSQQFGRINATGERELPADVLVILVDFADVTFDMTPDYPDSLAHNADYFDRYMIHLQSYMHDVSHGQYQFNYTLSEVVTLSREMGYYGNDDDWTGIIQFAVEIVQLLDADTDFNLYDSFIIFHAGAGQESDLHHNHTDEIWSTFIDLWDMREAVEEALENDEISFPVELTEDGILTDEGVYVKELVVCPESEYQADFTEDDPVLGMLGVVCHQFGHQLGLPTLYDNVSSNGRSAGIGNWGLMGTGAWNALGYVPPMMCGWAKMYLGWETPVELAYDITDAVLDNIREDGTTPRLYKIDISETEYFLIENRQQNPDGSTSNAEGNPPSFSFELLPTGEQKYYEAGHPNEGDPRFDFMTNSYQGCEWDFYLPGLGGPDTPVIDGSGMLIWHIDEAIIEANFTTDFQYNSINGYAPHKGIDLEEADGIQHMDTNYPDMYRYGGPYDTFHEDNNNYFGMSLHPDTQELSLPTAESYYGGGQMEIYDISANGMQMTFSMRREWSLRAHYEGDNPLSPIVYR